MQAERRVFFLEAMGVPQWFARVRLPGARPSELSLIEPSRNQIGQRMGMLAPEAIGVVAEGVTSPEPVLEPSVSLKGLTEGLAQKEELRKSAVSQDETVTLAGAQPVSKAPIESQVLAQDSGSQQSMSLRAYKFDSALVITDCNTDHPDATERVLANNILFAALRVRAEMHEAAIFEWPIFARPEFAGIDMLEGRALLHRWLDELLEGEDSRPVFVFGAPECLNEALAAKKLSENRVFRFEYTLSALLAQPRLKKEVWAVMQGRVIPALSGVDN